LLKAGNKNTTLFHNLTKMQRVINQVDNIKVDEDREIRGQKDLKKEAHNHFKKLLTTNSTN